MGKYLALVFSDSHGLIPCALKAVELAKELGRYKRFIHLGDGLKDIKDIINDPNFDKEAEVEYVGAGMERGFFNQYEKTKTLTIKNNTFFLTHGDLYGVKDGLEEVSNKAKEQKAYAALFGHTHEPLCKQVNGVWCYNPGSILIQNKSTSSGYSRATYGVLEVSEKGVEFKVYEFDVAAGKPSRII